MIGLPNILSKAASTSNLGSPQNQQAVNNQQQPQPQKGQHQPQDPFVVKQNRVSNSSSVFSGMSTESNTAASVSSSVSVGTTSTTGVRRLSVGSINAAKPGGMRHKRDLIFAAYTAMQAGDVNKDSVKEASANPNSSLTAGSHGDGAGEGQHVSL
jgi:hypothetical protein